MQRVYPTRINWENKPSINTPINESNLNKIDAAVYEIDGRVVGYDTSKANQSDLLTTVSSVDYNENTGVFIFTWKNGTTKTVDLNIEKIPVSFSMSDAGIITMTTADGTEFIADVSALIKNYAFTDSDNIAFTVTTDDNGNKTIVANIVTGSIGENEIDPTILADMAGAAQYAEEAKQYAEEIGEYIDDAEAWAVGQRKGIDVDYDDITYHNSSKWWAQKAEEAAGQAQHTSFSALDDVNIDNVQNKEIPIYNSEQEKWVNGKLLVELTQAEYDALSSEEKTADIYYWITDSSTVNQMLYGKLIYGQSLTLEVEDGRTVSYGSPVTGYGDWAVSDTGYRVVSIGTAIAYDNEGNAIEGLDIVITNITQRPEDTLVEFKVFNKAEKAFTVDANGVLDMSVPDLTYYKIVLFGIRFNNNYYAY